MLLRPFAELPSKMQNDSVCEMYKLLSEKKQSLLIKRMFDVVTAMGLLALLLPVMAIIATIILVDGEGAVLFRQSRKTAWYQTFVI